MLVNDTQSNLGDRVHIILVRWQMQKHHERHTCGLFTVARSAPFMCVFVCVCITLKKFIFNIVDLFFPVNIDGYINYPNLGDLVFQAPVSFLLCQ